MQLLREKRTIFLDNNDVTHAINIAASSGSEFAGMSYYLIVKLRAKIFISVSLWLK